MKRFAEKNAAAVHVSAETWVRAIVCGGFFVLISVSLVFFLIISLKYGVLT